MRNIRRKIRIRGRNSWEYAKSQCAWLGPGTIVSMMFGTIRSEGNLSVEH